MDDLVFLFIAVVMPVKLFDFLFTILLLVKNVSRLFIEKVLYMTSLIALPFKLIIVSKEFLPVF